MYVSQTISFLIFLFQINTKTYLLTHIQSLSSQVAKVPTHSLSSLAKFHSHVTHRNCYTFLNHISSIYYTVHMEKYMTKNIHV